MTNGRRDPLDEALAGLPRDVEPQSDLWPKIESQLGDGRGRAPLRHSATRQRFSWKLAASVLLVAGASVTALIVTRQGEPRQAPRIAGERASAPALEVQPASFGSELLGTQYVNARAELDRLFEERLATLAPETRDKLQTSLSDMRRATREISDILAEHPSDPLLQQLLLSAYQNELKLLADVTDMTTPSPRVDL